MARISLRALSLLWLCFGSACAAVSAEADAGRLDVAPDAGADWDGGPPIDCGPAIVHPDWRCEVLGGPLASPRDAWVTRAGDIVVSEFGAGRIVRFEAGEWVPIAEGLNLPIGLREGSDGRLIVGEEGAHSVAFIDPATGLRTPIAEDLRAVTYLTLDARGMIFVSRFDDTGGDVLRIDPATGAVTEFATGLSVPEGLFVDDAGALFVAEWQLPSAILRFDRAGTRADATTLATGFDHVYGLLQDGTGFLVGDHAGRVVRYDDAGASEILLDDIGRPGGLARDTEGRIIVVEFVDFGAVGRVLRLSPR